MSILFYAIAICFVVNIGLYFHSGNNVILTLLIVILLIVFCRVVKVPLVLSVKNSSDISRGNYKKLRVDMSSSERNLNTPERNKSVLGFGLFSNYDSRLGRSRSSLKSNTSLSESVSVKSPNRTNCKVTKLASDENYVYKQVENEMPSPIRSGTSPFRSTPLSYSKRFNVNPQSSLYSSPRSINPSRFSLVDRNSPSKVQQSPDSSTRSLNCEERSPSTFSGRMITVANQMDSDQFPWIAYNGSIPMILSNSQKASSPVTKISSPSSDANSSFKNRVRIRLSKPNKSDTSFSNSTIENSSNLDESSTTKSVIQVLKEIARKRCLATEEEEEHEGEPQAKRRTEHNLYLSRLEGEEEEQVPLTKLRLNGEDERTKRTREPDWDTSSVSNPKRPRKSYNFVNNEIISSLSSSIGLQPFKHSQRKKSTRKSIAIQVQTLVPEDNVGGKKEQADTPSQISKSPPKTRDAGVETDPLPEPRPRSPVKEKVVSDVKGILKSALKKFDIQPSTSVTIGSDSMVTSPINNIPPALPNASSASLLTVFSSTNQSASAPSINSETTRSPFGLTTSKSILESTSNVFTTPTSTPKMTFGFSSTSAEKTSEAVTTNESKQELSKANGDKLGFKLENKDVSSTDSSPKFGLTSSDTKIEPSVSQSQVTNSSLFNFKAPDIPASTQASSAVSSSSAFTFGAPKTSEASKAKTAEEQKSIFGGSTLSTPVTSSITLATSAVQSQNASQSAANTSNSTEQKAGLPKSSVFTFQNKSSESVKSTADKKEAMSSSIFSFGKTENKSTPANSNPESKPFQFGSGGFTFGQAGSKASSDSSNNATSQPVSTAPPATTNTTTMQPTFSFSSSSAKKDANAGGFTFNAPANTSNDQKSLFNFNTSSSFGSTSTTTKSTFPASLFGNNTENPGTSTAPNANVTNTFGNAMSSSAPTLGISTATSTAPTFGSTATSNAPTFGSTATSTAPAFGSTATSTASTFGSTVSSSTPAFGSAVSSSAPTFGSAVSSSAPTFGSALSSSAPTFGSAVSSTAPTFGSAVSSTAPTFGSTAASSAPSFGNTAATSAPTFGSTAVTSAPAFGNTATSTAPTFGNTATSTAPTFGSSEAPKSVFGNVSTQPSFGNPVTNAPVFGSNITANENNKPSVFGSSSTITSPPAFGASNANSTVPTFGSVATANSNPPAFGTTSGTAQPTFGSSAAGVSNNPTFGNTTNTSIPTFGSGGGSAFGSTTAGSTFSSGTAVSGTNPSPFGASSAGPSAPGFSGTSNVPSFGGTQAFGGSSSVPAFGSSSNTTFGSSTTAAPAFGNQAQPSFGSQPGTSFGSSSTFGQTSSTPTFGNQNTFNTQNTTTPAFGSTSAFGSGSTNTSFGTTSVPGTTPAFGTTPTPAFGTSSTFGNQEASKPFTFNAPAPQPAQTGTFNFTAPQAQQSSGGLFQFGAGSTSAPSNQPFQFNASQSSTPGFTAGFSPGVGGTGQQMFSIGSGSTAPRRMTGRRKK